MGPCCLDGRIGARGGKSGSPGAFLGNECEEASATEAGVESEGDQDAEADLVGAVLPPDSLYIAHEADAPPIRRLCVPRCDGSESSAIAAVSSSAWMSVLTR